MNTAPRIVLGFRVERTYTSFARGETRTEMIPKVFKIARGAGACAQRYLWVTDPDRHTRADAVDACVIQTPKGVR